MAHGVCQHWPGNPELFDLETGMPVVPTVGNIASKFGFSNFSLCTLRTDGWTDEQTDRQNQRLLPLSYGRQHNKRLRSMYCTVEANY